VRLGGARVAAEVKRSAPVCHYHGKEKHMKRFMLFVVLLSSALTARAVCTNPPPFPNPQIFYQGATSDNGYIRYHFGVANHAQYSNVLFAASPSLPPCGLNTSAARTWLWITDQNGKHLYGYCALKSSIEMQKLTFSVSQSAPQPKSFRIRLNDRLCEKTVLSNVVALN